MRGLPPYPTDWSPADENDSRGPGLYCPRCNSFNAVDAKSCRFCGEEKKS